MYFTLRILEAMQPWICKRRLASIKLYIGIWQSHDSPNEQTPFYPNPKSQSCMHTGLQHYREAYGFFTCNGILFNHESPVRGETFVTRKVTRALARIKLGLQETLWIGNLDALRDWGHAKDYVEAMWLMLQQEHPSDLVIATGEQHSVRDFIELAADLLELRITWQGEGQEEIGLDDDGRTIISIDPRYFRPTEVDSLLGDSSHARDVLGWSPSISFRDLVAEMVRYDLELARREVLLSEHEL